MLNLIDVVVIDPFKQEIRWERVNNNGDPREFADLMGCERVDIVKLGVNIIMFCDDDGLLFENRYFSFKAPNVKQAYAGICLLAISNDSGDVKSFDKDIGAVRQLVEWKHKGYKEEPFMAFVPLDDTILH